MCKNGTKWSYFALNCFARTLLCTTCTHASKVSVGLCSSIVVLSICNLSNVWKQMVTTDTCWYTDPERGRTFLLWSKKEQKWESGWWLWGLLQLPCAMFNNNKWEHKWWGELCDLHDGLLKDTNQKVHVVLGPADRFQNATCGNFR